VLSVGLSIVSSALLALLLLSFSSGADLYYVYIQLDIFKRVLE